MHQLKSDFQRIIYWNKYLSKPKLLAQNSNLTHLVFENDAQRTSNKKYYLPMEKRFWSASKKQKNNLWKH